MGFPTVTVIGDSVRTPKRVSITATVTEQFTEESPARLEITSRNEATTHREFLFGPNAPFGPLSGKADSGAKLHVIPFPDESSLIPTEPLEGCWKLTDHYTVFDRGLIWQAEPGASMNTEYAILDDPDTESCLSPGSYQFRGEWGERHTDTDDERFEWDFQIILEQ